MAYRGSWASGIDFNSLDTVQDAGANFYEAEQAHRSESSNSPESGRFTSRINVERVEMIVGSMFAGQDVSHSGINAVYDEDDGAIILSSTRSIGFPDIHQAMIDHLQGRPPAQYYIVINKETAD